jgi:hypothetical protein
MTRIGTCGANTRAVTKRKDKRKRGDARPKAFATILDARPQNRSRQAPVCCSGDVTQPLSASIRSRSPDHLFTFKLQTDGSGWQNASIQLKLKGPETHPLTRGFLEFIMSAVLACDETTRTVTTGSV